MAEPSKEENEIIFEDVMETHANPTTKNELDSLYSYENATCKIKFEKNNKIHSGTGFFIKDYENIPFNAALFTNNHVINNINIDEEIKFEYNKEIKSIIITENRKAFTSKEFDYTCIEIFDSDNIINFFKIDENILNNRENLINKEIFILQYPNGQLAHDSGKIINIEDNKIKHSVSTNPGSSGSPLIKRYNNNLILGIHYGAERDINKKIINNLATPFDVIIKDIKDKLSKNKNEFRNIITLIYEKNIKNKTNQIFGSKFVKSNEDNISLIINGKESKLVEKYDLKVGVNTIQMKIKNKLKNLNNMFAWVDSLKNIDELKYLDTSEVTDFSFMFSNCISLSDIKGLENWNVSNGKKFESMFSYCSSLSNLNEIENWDVSNGINFVGMFSNCRALTNIKGLEKWNVSNGNNFSALFFNCLSLSDIKGLENWNVSKGVEFSFMFHCCSSLSSIKELEKWNTSSGNNFQYMFYCCSSLSNLKGVEKWDVSNGNDFSLMFALCSSLSDIKGLENWNVPNGKIFKYMFKYMFTGCLLLSEIKDLEEKWNKGSHKKIFL